MTVFVLSTIYVTLALFIAWIWVDYFRLIDVFEKESLLRVAFTFLLGAGSVFLVFAVHDIWPDPFGLTLDGTLLGDFLYCSLSIGLVEECAKGVPVIIVILLFRKYINEPVDYVSTFSVAALGFAAAENVLYFWTHGADLISSRAILSNVGHMMFASLTAYGVILVTFRKSKPAWLVIPAFLLCGSVFHGLYDLGLMHADAGWFGTIFTIALFFVGVSVFATILNNALNISPFFTYRHVINSSGVAIRLLIYYFILFVLQCIIMGVLYNLRTVLAHVLEHAFIILPIVIITVVRLSRFKLIKGRWNWVKFELPFSFGFWSNNRLGLRIAIKGDPFSDHHINKHYESYFLLCPVRKDSSYLKQCRKAYIFRKLYINGDIAHYAARIFVDESMTQSQTVLLQLKRQGISMMNNYPVVAILEAENAENIDTSNEPITTPFLEWAVVKPIPQAQGLRP